MGAASWAIPVGVLAGIVVIGFAFVWWWFPRAWTKGNKNEVDLQNQLSAPEREAQRAKNREIIERFTRARAIERGEIVEEPAVDVQTEHDNKPGADVRTGEVGRYVIPQAS